MFSGAHSLWGVGAAVVSGVVLGMILSVDEMWEWLRTPEALAGALWVLGIAVLSSVLFEALRSLVRSIVSLRRRSAHKAAVKAETASEKVSKPSEVLCAVLSPPALPEVYCERPDGHAEVSHLGKYAYETVGGGIAHRSVEWEPGTERIPVVAPPLPKRYADSGVGGERLFGQPIVR